MNKHILFIVENLPVPLDRRTWQQALALSNSGADVSVICPKMKGYVKKFEIIDGIEIHRHPLPVEASSALGYLAEYSTALFWEFFLCLKIFLKKRFHVIEACNPPDLIFLVALPFKLFGVKYVFDHHDLTPELYIAKFNKKNFFYKLMLLFEKLNYKTADYSIATNLSYKEIAMKRGGMNENKIEVVRSGPSLEKFIISEGNAKYKKGKKFLVGYVGIIGAQDGLDVLMHIIAHVVKKRNDVHFAIMGDGTDLEKTKTLAQELSISAFIDFYGMISDQKLLVEILNTCDVGVSPDIPTDMNNFSTMNKVLEYMALKKPIVQFDLKEGRYSAQEASLYAKNFDNADFAEKIIYLLENPDKRKKMGEYGYQRIVNELAWEHQRKKYLDFYQKILS